MQAFEVSTERSGLLNEKKKLGRKWKVGGVIGIMLVVGVVLMVGYGGQKSDGANVVATQEHLEQFDTDTQNFDAADMSVPETDDGEEDEDAEVPEIEADGVNIIKLAEDKYGILNSYKCPPGLYLVKATYGKGGNRGCVCKICPKGHACNNNKKKKCRCGTFQSNKGQRKCIKVNCGEYVPKVGSWYKIKCNYGTYSKHKKGSKYFNCGCIKSPRGYAVGKRGACGAKKCKGNNAQHCTGQRFCIPCGKYTYPSKNRRNCVKKYPKYPKYY